MQNGLVQRVPHTLALSAGRDVRDTGLSRTSPRIPALLLTLGQVSQPLTTALPHQ